MDANDGLDLKWLEQMQSAGGFSIDSDMNFETAVCSAEFQNWLEGTDVLGILDPAIASRLPSGAGGGDSMEVMPTGVAAAVSQPPAPPEGQQGVTVTALTQQANNFTVHTGVAVKQEAGASQTMSVQPGVSTPGLPQASQQPQDHPQQQQASTQQYQQPVQQQQAHITAPQQQQHQHQHQLQQQQQQPQWSALQQSYTPQPQQQQSRSYSLPPAGYLPNSAATNSIAYMQPLQPLAAISKIPGSLAASAPMAYVPAYSMGFVAGGVGPSQPAWMTQTVLPAAQLSAANSMPATGPMTFGSSGWASSGSEAAQPPAARSPRKGRDGSRNHAGSRGRSRSKSAVDDDADFTGLAITKSGIASRRFRARQKNLMASLEDELTAKLQELQVLTDENESLKLKEAVLAAAVEAGEDQMRLLQQAGPPVFDKADLLAEQAKSGSSGLGHSRADTPANSSNTAATADSSMSRVATPAAAADMGMASTADSGAARSGVVAPGASLQLQPQQEFVLSEADLSSPEAVKCMSSDDILASWKQFLKDLTRELMNLQTETAAAALQASKAAAAGGAAADEAAAAAVALLPPGAAGGPPVSVGVAGYHRGFGRTAVGQRLNALVLKYSTMVRLASALNPGAYCRLFGRHIDTGLPTPYSDDHWKSVIAQINLSQEQVKAILACADLYFSHMAKVQQERTHLKQKLKQSDVAREQLLNDTGMNPGSPWLVGLSSNLKREHVLRAMLNCYVWEKLLTPLQAAKACIYSHPFYPDMHAIVCVLSDMVRGPAANDNMFAAATAGAMRQSSSDADLEQRLLRWKEAANASLAKQPRTRLTLGTDFMEMLAA